jgi:hypothetical protein
MQDDQPHLAKLVVCSPSLPVGISSEICAIPFWMLGFGDRLGVSA